MNFFSHAVVAAWFESEPPFVLGAMIPDFATMIGAKRPQASDPRVLAGMRFHEQTDAVFHRAPTFVALQREARLALSAAGLRRGSDRAAAHVGLELLIDGELVRDHAAREVYTQALDLALSPHVGGLVWASQEDERRFAELCARLEQRSRDGGTVDAGVVADRVAGALGRRPRLCLDGAGREAVRSWAERTEPQVAARIEPLLRELILGLRAEGVIITRSAMLEP